MIAFHCCLLLFCYVQLLCYWIYFRSTYVCSQFCCCFHWSGNIVCMYCWNVKYSFLAAMETPVEVQNSHGCAQIFPWNVNGLIRDTFFVLHTTGSQVLVKNQLLLSLLVLVRPFSFLLSTAGTCHGQVFHLVAISMAASCMLWLLVVCPLSLRSWAVLLFCMWPFIWF